MFLKVKLYGTLRRLSQLETPGLWQGEVPDGITIFNLIEYLGTRPEEVAAATINRVPCSLETIIQDGDEIILVTPFGGG
jgi:sulfur carrier protein ThiS